MKLFPEVGIKMPTKTVSQRGLGSWQEPRTPSELFDRAELFLYLGQSFRDDLITSGRTDFEQMGVELGLRPRQVKELLNGLVATPELEADGKTGAEWIVANKERFELMLDELASIDFSVDIYFDGAMEQHALAAKKAKIDSYLLSSRFLRDILQRVPEATKEFAKEAAEIVGDVAGSALKGASKGLGVYGTAIAIGILLLAVGVPLRSRRK